ncbi:hypothetical protein B0T10DRAFT_480665 [Thelonectria olida]|uniref:Sodium/calcium exchanger membrane region domain-containing protein n=1 Tax=Thelonectria olida TaxID=1576542 RepID=A0A9P8WB02_9HYPO|nr:hypothetical protein B0T10DRAFT_480665 [Thelonectria olida]
MDPGLVSFPTHNSGDGFSDSSASDNEEEPPDEIASSTLSIIDPSALGVRGRDGFWNTSPRIRGTIQNARHMWLTIKKRCFDASATEGTRSSFAHREVKATLTQQLCSMLLSSWFNLLLVFVPLGVGTYLAKMSPLLVFACNALAIVPLSSLLTEATERIAATAGDTIGALLNISFGNLVELILFIALANDQVRLVQASILGSILVNLLLILGSALVASSMANLEAIYNSVETQLLACLLFVSVFVILMPTAFAYTLDRATETDGAVIKMSRISALMILFIYVIYFVHEIRTRQSDSITIPLPNLDIENGHSIPSEPPFRPPIHRQTSGTHTLPPRTIRFADEGGGNSQEYATGKPNAQPDMETVDSAGFEISNSDFAEHRGRRGRETDNLPNLPNRPSSYQPLLRSHRHSRSLSMTSSRGYHSRDSSLSEGRRSFSSAFQVLRDNRTGIGLLVHDESRQDGPTNDRVASIAMLIITSIIMSICAEFLVSTIDDVTHEGGLSESLIGLIILPIVGNVSEYVTVVSVALRDKLDLAIAVSVGSAIQIALCVTPLTVMAGWALQKDLALSFNLFETAALVGSVLLANLLILTDGSSNLRTSGLKGALMCVSYAMIGLGACFFP